VVQAKPARKIVINLFIIVKYTFIFAKPKKIKDMSGGTSWYTLNGVVSSEFGRRLLAIVFKPVTGIKYR